MASPKPLSSKMTELTTVAYCSYQASNPELRDGQALMIALMELNRDLYIDITGMDIDPFYLDERIPAFTEYIKDRI